MAITLNFDLKAEATRRRNLEALEQKRMEQYTQSQADDLLRLQQEKVMFGSRAEGPPTQQGQVPLSGGAFNLNDPRANWISTMPMGEKRNAAALKLMDESYKKEAPKYDLKIVPDGKGGFTYQRISATPGAESFDTGIQAPGQVKMFKDPNEVAYSASDLAKFVDKTTGKQPLIGLTPAIASKNPNRYIVKEKGQTEGAAFKQAMIDTATAMLPAIQAGLFVDGDPSKGIQSGNIWQMAAQDMIPLARWFTSPEAQKMLHGYTVGVQSITRGETGAAMRDEEVENTAKRFMPKPGDSKELIMQKWRAYNLFIGNAKRYLNPNATKSDPVSGQSMYVGVLNVDLAMRDAKQGKPPGKIKRKIQ